MQSYTLDDIVVTASRSETAISDVPADVTLISEEQIERGNYKSVSDALKGANINVVQKGFAADRNACALLTPRSKLHVERV